MLTEIHLYRHGITPHLERTQQRSRIARAANPLHTYDLVKYRYDRSHEEILEKSNNAIDKIGLHFRENPVDAYFSSPFRRCLLTAQRVADITHQEFKIDSRLRDFAYLGLFRPRIEQFLEFLSRSDYDSVAICTHGAVIAAMTYLLTKGNYYIWNLGDHPEPGVLVTISNGEVKQLDFRQ